MISALTCTIAMYIITGNMLVPLQRMASTACTNYTEMGYIHVKRASHFRTYVNCIKHQRVV